MRINEEIQFSEQWACEYEILPRLTGAYVMDETTHAAEALRTLIKLKTMLKVMPYRREHQSK